MPRHLRPYVLSAILLIIVSALAALLTGEWIYLGQQRGQAVRAGGQPPASLPETQLLPDDFSLPTLHLYQQLVERPLFMESRRPGQPPSAEPPPPPPPQAPPPIALKLMGILSTPEGKMVLIADAKGKYKRMKLHDALEGWQIAEIKLDRLRMEQSGFKEELLLLKKRPKGAPAARPPAQPPQPIPPNPQPNQRPPAQRPGPAGYPPPRPPMPGNEGMMEVPDEPELLAPGEDDGMEGFDPDGSMQ
jgi:hypothetical protein